MKKFSLVLGFAFLACMVFGQNTATVNQFGSNIGSVLQTGSDNGATIQQGFAGANVTNNVNQPGGGWKEGSYIQQVGKENTAATTVRTSGNGTSIYQLGDENSATQDVGSSYEETTSFTKMGLDIDQLGNSNLATQKTIGSFGSHGVQGMTILQKGNFNVANQVSVGGMATNQSISQIGDNNNNPTKSGNTFDLSSVSSLTNPVAVLGNPLTSLAYRFNNGYGTTVALPMTQYSNQRYGSAIMNVTGNDNNTYQFQEYGVWLTSGANDVILTLKGNKNDVAQGQLGEKNLSEIDMTGDDNVVSTSQFGDSNEAHVNILGSLNVVGIEQTGDFNDATVNQVGSSNIARVIQQP